MTKAVVFTHFDIKPTMLDNPNGLNSFFVRQGGFFRNCLSCKNIGLVFVYVSYGIEDYLTRFMGDFLQEGQIVIPMEIISNEERIFNGLRLTVDWAIDELAQGSCPVSTDFGASKFVYIGVRELADLLNRLHQRDPQLIAYLSHDGHLTYDSPKFVEAVIRIARGAGGNTTGIAEHPILRIDADVEVNDNALEQVIARDHQFRKQQLLQPFWWFSGGYSGCVPDDPVNMHAVRVHWLIDPSTWENPNQFMLLPNASNMLRDLGELGATQVESAHSMSTQCQNLVAARQGHSQNRPTPQVISGAGLVTSLSAIRKLPPFMNAKSMIVWIDDHLKRRLHEVIGDLPPDSLERLGTAVFRQHRHPNGIDANSIEWARGQYFKRLLSGCLMHATIVAETGDAGPLGVWVKGICNGVRTTLSRDDEGRLTLELTHAASERYDEVVAVWKDADYGNNILRDWTRKLSASDKEIVCSDVVAVGVAYIKLLLRWDAYVGVIEALGPLEAYWLFTRVR